VAATVSDWRVYLLRCADDSLYAGITNNLEKRLQQHNGELVGGARYTRGRRPVELVWQEGCESRGEALRREMEIKRLTREQKSELVSGGNE
jgi:putative endonuclease